jgi:hypothetical protein
MCGIRLRAANTVAHVPKGSTTRVDRDMGAVGFEPTASSASRKRSPPELSARQRGHDTGGSGAWQDRRPANYGKEVDVDPAPTTGTVVDVTEVSTVVAVADLPVSRFTPYTQVSFRYTCVPKPPDASA